MPRPKRRRQSAGGEISPADQQQRDGKAAASDLKRRKQQLRTYDKINVGKRLPEIPSRTFPQTKHASPRGLHDTQAVSTEIGGITWQKEHAMSQVAINPHPEREIEVLKCILLREGYIERFKNLSVTVARQYSDQAAEEKLTDLIDLIRDITLDTVEHIQKWQRGMPQTSTTTSTTSGAGGGNEYHQQQQQDSPQFVWNGLNYLLRIPSDLNFLKKYPALVSRLGLGAAMRNPLLVPSAMDEDSIPTTVTQRSPAAGASLGMARKRAHPSMPGKPKTSRMKKMHPYETAIVNDKDMMPVTPTTPAQQQQRRRNRENTLSDEPTNIPPRFDELALNTQRSLSQVDMTRVSKVHQVLLSAESTYGPYTRNDIGQIVPTSTGDDIYNEHGTHTKSPLKHRAGDGSNIERNGVLPKRPVGHARALKQGGSLLAIEKAGTDGRRQMPAARSGGARLDLAIKSAKRRTQELEQDIKFGKRRLERAIVSADEERAKFVENDGKSAAAGARLRRLETQVEALALDLSRRETELEQAGAIIGKKQHLRKLLLQRQQDEQLEMRQETLHKKEMERNKFASKVDSRPGVLFKTSDRCGSTNTTPFVDRQNGSTNNNNNAMEVDSVEQSMNNRNDNSSNNVNQTNNNSETTSRNATTIVAAPGTAAAERLVASAAKSARGIGGKAASTKKVWEAVCAVEIQRMVRGHHGRARYDRVLVLYNTGALIIQTRFRAVLGKKRALHTRRRRDSSVLLQSFHRGNMARTRVRLIRITMKKRRVAVAIQSLTRAIMGRKRMHRRRELYHATGECRRSASNVYEGGLLVLAKRKPDTVPQNLLMLLQACLILMARGVGPPSKQCFKSMTWKACKRAMRRPQFIAKINALSNAACGDALLLPESRIHCIRHLFHDPSFTAQAVTDAGGIVARMLFQWMVSLITCQRLVGHFLVDNPGQDATWQHVLSCDLDDGTELWDLHELDYDSDAVDPRHYVSDEVMYAESSSCRPRPRPVIVVMSCDIPTEPRRQIQQSLKRMLPGGFSHVSAFGGDKWSQHLFWSHNNPHDDDGDRKEDVEVEGKVGRGQSIDSSKRGSAVSIDDGTVEVSERKSEDAAVEVEVDDESESENFDDESSDESGEPSPYVDLAILQEVLDSGKSILLDVQLGIGHKSKSAFLRTMTTISKSLVPTPLCVLICGDNWNRGTYKVQCEARLQKLAEALVPHSNAFMHSNLVGLSDIDLKLLGGPCAPKGLRQVMASSLFELSTIEAHAQFGVLATVTKPPLGLVLLAEAMVVLLSPQEEFKGPSEQMVGAVSWETGAGLLTLEPGMLCAQLRAIDMDTIPPANARALQAYTNHPKWPRLSAVEKTTTLLGHDFNAKKLLFELKGATRNDGVPDVAYLLKSIPALQLLVRFLESCTQYAFALIKEGGPGFNITRKDSGGVFASVICVKDGLRALSAGYSLKANPPLVRRNGDLALESDGWQEALSEVISAIMRDTRVYSEAKKVPGLRMGSASKQRMLVLSVARDLGRFFIDSYDPQLCKRYVAYVMDEDVGALLSPNSIEMSKPPRRPPRNSQELYSRLVELVTLARPRQSNPVAPPYPETLILRRTRFRVLKRAVRIDSIFGVATLWECQMGELLVDVFVPHDQVVHEMLITCDIIEGIAKGTLSHQERQDLRSEQAIKMAPHLLDRLGFRRTLGGSGPSKLVLRTGAVVGRKLWEGTRRLGGVGVPHLISVYITSDTEELLLLVYERNTSTTVSFRLSRRARFELLGSVNAGKRHEWIEGCFERLRLRPGGQVTFNRTLFKTSLRVQYLVVKNHNMANGDLLIVDMVSFDDAKQLEKETNNKKDEKLNGSQSVTAWSEKEDEQGTPQKQEQVVNGEGRGREEATMTIGAMNGESGAQYSLNVTDEMIMQAATAGRDGRFRVESGGASHGRQNQQRKHKENEQQEGERSTARLDAFGGNGEDDDYDDDEAKSMDERALVKWPSNEQDPCEMCSTLEDVSKAIRIDIATNTLVLLDTNGKVLCRSLPPTAPPHDNNNNNNDDQDDESSPTAIVEMGRQSSWSGHTTTNTPGQLRASPGVLPDYIPAQDISMVTEDKLWAIPLVENGTRPDGVLVYRKAHRFGEIDYVRTQDDDSSIDVRDRLNNTVRVVLSFWRDRHVRGCLTVDSYDPSQQTHSRIDLRKKRKMIKALGSAELMRADPDERDEEAIISHLIENRLYLSQHVGGSLKVRTARLFGADKVTPINKCDVFDDIANKHNESLVVHNEDGKERGIKVLSVGHRLKVEGDHQFKGVPHEYVILTVFDMGTGNLLKEQGFGHAPLFRCQAYNPKRQTKCELLINPSELFESISGERNLLTRTRRHELVSSMLEMMRLKRSVRTDDVLLFAWREILQERRDQEEEEEEEEKEAQLQHDQQITDDVIDIYKLTDPRVDKWSAVLTRAMHLNGESPTSVVVTLNVVWLLPHGRAPQLWFTGFFPELSLTRTMAASRLFATMITKACAGLNTIQELADLVKKSLDILTKNEDEYKDYSDDDYSDDDNSDEDGEDDAALDEQREREAEIKKNQIAKRLEDIQDCLAAVCEAVMQVHHSKVEDSDIDIENRTVSLDESVVPNEVVAKLRDQQQKSVAKTEYDARENERDISPVAPAQTVLGSSIFRGQCVLRSAALISRRQVVVTMHLLLRITKQEDPHGQQQSVDVKRKSTPPDNVGMLVQVYCPSLSQHATCAVNVEHLGGLPSAATAEQLVRKLELNSEAVDNHMIVSMRGVQHAGEGIEVVVEPSTSTSVAQKELAGVFGESEVGDDNSGGSKVDGVVIEEGKNGSIATAALVGTTSVDGDTEAKNVGGQAPLGEDNSSNSADGAKDNNAEAEDYGADEGNFNVV